MSIVGTAVVDGDSVALTISAANGTVELPQLAVVSGTVSLDSGGANDGTDAP